MLSFALLKRIKNKDQNRKYVVQLHGFNTKIIYFSMCQLGTRITKTVCPGAKQCATGTRAQPNYTSDYQFGKPTTIVKFGFRNWFKNGRHVGL